MDSSDLFNDLNTAIVQLEDALTLSADNNVIKAGCIQYFEFCFELAWKTVKRFAEEDGISECNSPKSALKAAFAAGWIGDEEIWLDMLMSRNKMSHTYNATSALTVYDKLPDYLDAFRLLQGKLKEL